jgi:hypothetical protein
MLSVTLFLGKMIFLLGRKQIPEHYHDILMQFIALLEFDERYLWTTSSVAYLIDYNLETWWWWWWWW